MRSLVVEKNLRRMVSAKLLAETSVRRSLQWGPLSLKDLAPPKIPTPQWQRVRPLLSGICGSDLATVLASTTRYFEPLVSFPFTPGHEIVGVTGEHSERVVVEAALTCTPRGVEPCRSCSAGHDQLCESVTIGDIKQGIQIGYCSSTGGGWSQELVAHRSQLWTIKDILSDEDAVLIEPFACALHAVATTAIPDNTTVAVLGTGTMGLLTLAALKYLHPTVTVLTVAKHPIQRESATRLGADEVISHEELQRSARRSTRAFRKGQWLSSGYGTVFDCVGSSSSISSSLKAVKPGGQVVAVGMPSYTGIDLTPLWHREVSLRGAYAYGTETFTKKAIEHLDLQEQTSFVSHGDTISIRTFDLAIFAMEKLKLGWMVTHRFPLENYSEAIDKAANAGSQDAIKIVFDLRKAKSISKGTNDL